MTTAHRYFYNWLSPVWEGYVLFGGYADLNYTCQITHNALITIG